VLDHPTLLSLSPDRSSPVVLDEQTLSLSDDLYVYVEDKPEVDRVTFYVDDPDQLEPIVERLAPYDLAGSNDDGTAIAHPADQLGQGDHTITTVVRAVDAAGNRSNAVTTAIFRIR
jgi:hypothetical protein